MILDGHVAIVTGASRGLGSAIARRLADEGCAVCVNYRNSTAKAEALTAELLAQGRKAIALRADIADPKQAKEMVDAASRELGPVTILVNNAGEAYRATLDTFEQMRMQRMRETNVDGLIHVTRAVLPSMKQQHYGRIVNITSIAAHGTSLPGTTFYAATKAAVGVLTKRFAMELGSFGITVNAIAPGFILTELVKEGRTEEEYQNIVKRVQERSMVHRVGSPDDIAHAVNFLVSPASSFITAQTLTVDGGRTDYIGHP